MRKPECEHLFGYVDTEKKIIKQNGFPVEVSYCKVCGEELKRRLISDDERKDQNECFQKSKR